MTEDKINDHSSNLPDFLDLYLNYERRIYSYILSLLPHWADADDMMQETSKILWMKFDSFRTGSDFLSWSLTIARFQVLNYYKTRKTNAYRFSNKTIDNIESQLQKNESLNSDVRDALSKCIDRLDDKDKLLIKLRYDYDSNVKKVASATGRGIDAIYKALSRIHEQLFHCIRRVIFVSESRP